MVIKISRNAMLLFSACVLAMGVATNARAALNSLDSAFGADTITRDTDTGLLWLDVILSTAYSYDGVLPELQPGGVFEGFRLATSDEVLTFWANAGINVGVGFLGSFTPENFDPIVDLMSLVSVTGPNLGNLGGGNFFDYTAGNVESGPGGGGWVTVATLGADPDPTITGRPSFGTVPSDNPNETHGSWLVLVPEPAAPLVFALGILIVGWTTRRTKG